MLGKILAISEHKCEAFGYERLREPRKGCVRIGVTGSSLFHSNLVCASPDAFESCENGRPRRNLSGPTALYLMQIGCSGGGRRPVLCKANTTLFCLPERQEADPLFVQAGHLRRVRMPSQYIHNVV